MTVSDFKSLVRQAREQIEGDEKSRKVGPCPVGGPRFELFHSGPSLCSNKVRAVLAEKNIGYLSHDMNVVAAGGMIPENYRPSYVRMRMLGGSYTGLASGYSGRSSVTTEGLDPCVVPTLVDHEKERVIVDSSRICNYLDRESNTGTKLIPNYLADDIAAQIKLIDQAPHPAALYGVNPEGDRRPPEVRMLVDGIQERKILAINSIIAELDPNDPIIGAYQCKIAKETGSQNFVRDPENMREVYGELTAHVDALEAQLQKLDGEWAFGDDYTMADVLWTVSLFRMDSLGLAHAWDSGEQRPRVAEYTQRAIQRPSFQEAVVNWPFLHGPKHHFKE